MRKITLSLLAACVTVFIAAEINYQMAITAAKASEGSDIAIEETLNQYGFYMDALDPARPGPVVKLKALFKITSNVE